MDDFLLNKMIKEGYVNVQKHQQADLFIYNYSAKAQYECIWNEVTLACRGLILDGSGNVVARPFKKFFNLGEIENQKIPNSPFEVFEKMDGSLGISYLLDNQMQVASRGSFHSDQALKATEMLHTKYAQCLPKMHSGHTYLFEIIYPNNRVVVDYGKTEALILIAIINIATGSEIELHDIGFPIVKKYNDLNDLDVIKKLQNKEKEGFVIKYNNGYRLKIKFEEYLRLHRIMTQITTVSIWEYMRNGQSMEDFLRHVPDEFYNWIKEQKKKLIDKFELVEKEAKQEYKTFETRKEAAIYFLNCKYPSILFAMLDGKDYSPIIWKLIKPIFAKPFKNQKF